MRATRRALWRYPGAERADEAVPSGEPAGLLLDSPPRRRPAIVGIALADRGFSQLERIRPRVLVASHGSRRGSSSNMPCESRHEHRTEPRASQRRRPAHRGPPAACIDFDGLSLSRGVGWQLAPICAVVSATDCRTTIVLPLELRDELADLSRASERSLSAEIRVAVREHVSRSTSRSPSDDGVQARRPALGVLDVHSHHEEANE